MSLAATAESLPIAIFEEQGSGKSQNQLKLF